MDFAQEEEIRLVKDEYNRFISRYDHDSFVLNCKIRSRLLIENHRDGARFIADEAIRALGCSEPLLMVRIGEGEGNLLRFALHPDEFELKWVNAAFLIHDNQTRPIEDARRLSRELSELLASADIRREKVDPDGITRNRLGRGRAERKPKAVRQAHETPSRCRPRG